MLSTRLPAQVAQLVEQWTENPFSPPDASKAATKFWKRIDRSGGPNACWPWIAKLNEAGYPSHRKHRDVLALKLGRPIAPGMHTLHSCDNPRCCNPAHLSEGTVHDNNDDRCARGRSIRGERHPKAKLTEAQAAQIKFKEFPPAWKVAKKYGVHRGTVTQIWLGYIWRHLAADRSAP